MIALFLSFSLVRSLACSHSAKPVCFTLALVSRVRAKNKRGRGEGARGNKEETGGGGGHLRVVVLWKSSGAISKR